MMGLYDPPIWNTPKGEHRWIHFGRHIWAALAIEVAQPNTATMERYKLRGVGVGDFSLQNSV